MVPRFKTAYKIFLWCSVAQFFMMINTHVSGLDSLWQIVLEIPVMIIGIIACLWAFILGIILQNKASNDKRDPQWTTGMIVRFISIPLIAIGIVVWTDVMAR